MSEAALGRLRASQRPRVLLVSHAHGGGIGRHVEELAAALAPRAEVLLATPLWHTHLALRWLREGEGLSLWFGRDGDWEGLLQVLRAIGIDRVHVHHVHGWPRAVMDLPRLLDCPFDVTLHDHFAICRGYHLTTAEQRFCGGERSCAACPGGQWGLSVEAWRATFAAWLGTADRVIAPSRDCASRLARFVPAVRPLVWPHGERPQPVPERAVRVLVPGAISIEKGMVLLQACVDDARSRGLALHFRVVGFTARAIEPWPANPYSVTGEYPEGELPGLLALERGDVVFFPAQCAETFSYTLSAALATGLPIVSTDLGALGERLEGRPGCRVLPWNSPAAAFNAALAAAGQGTEPAERTSASPSSGGFARDGGVRLEEYAQRYAEPLPGRARGPAQEPSTLPSRWLDPPSREEPYSTLPDLFEDGVLCGRAASLARLRANVVPAEAARQGAIAAVSELRAQLSAERASALARVAEHEARARGWALAADEARRRLAVVESSRSWRLTRPLRALAEALRRMRG